MFFQSFHRRVLAVLFFVLAGLGGCASQPESAAKKDGGGFVLEKKDVDKYEPINRKIFAFNMTVDRWMLKPVAKGYRWIAPEPVEIGVSNFFGNLREVRYTVNDILQWKWKKAGTNGGRFVVNSTVGLLGFFDVAKHMGLEKNEGEDFGQTLSQWGVPQGPYIMLPFLGPATVRSGVGVPFDWYANPVREVTPKTSRYALTAADLVDARASFLDVEELITGDMYLFVRDAYLQRREFLNNDGVIKDDFGSDDFGDDEFSF